MRGGGGGGALNLEAFVLMASLKYLGAGAAIKALQLRAKITSRVPHAPTHTGRSPSLARNNKSQHSLF